MSALPEWRDVVRLRPTSTGLDPQTLAPGRDIVLHMPRQQAQDLASGVLLDDWLDAETRDCIDREAIERLAAWQSRRRRELAFGTLSVSQIWELELLADVFLPETRIVSGIAAAFRDRRPRRLEIESLDAARIACIRAVLGPLGVDVAQQGPSAAAPRYPSVLAAPWRIPLWRRSAAFLFRAVGLPQRVRGEVYFLPYWHLLPVYERLVDSDALQPLLVFQKTTLRSLARSAARGGWAGRPNAIRRRRSRHRLFAAVAAARRTDGASDSLARLLDIRALAMLEQSAAETLAEFECLRDAFRSKALRLAVLPFDSPPPARMVVQAARDAGVPTLVVQHGFANDPSANDPDLTLADAVAVWSDVDRLALSGRTSQLIEVTGNPGVANPAALLGNPQRAHVPHHTVVLVEYSSRITTRLDNRVSIRHVNTALCALVAARPRAPVTVRPHPAEHEPDIFVRAAVRYPELNIRVDTTTPIGDLIASADLFVGAVSTASLQAAAEGVPVVFLNATGGRQPWPFDGSTDVPVASNSEELAALILEVLASGEVPGRAEMIDALGVKTDAVDRVIELMTSIVRGESVASG
jgi:hypothetical protein